MTLGLQSKCDCKHQPGKVSFKETKATGPLCFVLVCLLCCSWSIFICAALRPSFCPSLCCQPACWGSSWGSSGSWLPLSGSSFLFHRRGLEWKLAPPQAGSGSTAERCKVRKEVLITLLDPENTCIILLATSPLGFRFLLGR